MQLSIVENETSWVEMNRIKEEIQEVDFTATKKGLLSGEEVSSGLCTVANLCNSMSGKQKIAAWHRLFWISRQIKGWTPYSGERGC